MMGGMDETTVPDLYRLAFMPGCFRCPTCGFVLSKTCINSNLEIMGTREQDRESEPCPNDGTMLVHVTYREQLEVYAARLKEEFERLAQYRWRPISEIHEDYGPCVLMRIDDPGYLEVGSSLDPDFDEREWTHFTEVPKLTGEEAERLKAAMVPVAEHVDEG
jgi:hypothetical protein